MGCATKTEDRMTTITRIDNPLPGLRIEPVEHGGALLDPPEVQAAQKRQESAGETHS